MDKLIKRHYNAIVNRDLITPTTEPHEFLEKMEEELKEIFLSFNYGTGDELKQELIDLSMVCLNFLQYMKVDIKAELLKNVLIQEKRANESKDKKKRA